MTEISDFGLVVLAVSATVFVALLGMRLADRLSLPYAAVILVGAMALAETSDSVQDALSILNVERLTVVALVIILFDGGLHIGFRRFRQSLAPILALGVLGTFASAGLIALRRVLSLIDRLIGFTDPSARATEKPDLAGSPSRGTGSTTR